MSRSSVRILAIAMAGSVVACGTIRANETDDGGSDGGAPACVIAPGTECKVETVSSGNGGSFDIVGDATHVYWTHFGSGLVMRAAHSGGPAEILAMNQSNPEGIALDEEYVYWAAYGDGRILRMPKNKGPLEEIATGQTNAFDVAVDDTHVYWTNAVDPMTNPGVPSRVMRAPKTGGPAEIIADNQDRAFYLTVDPAFVYWTERNGGVIYRQIKTGGALEVLGANQDNGTPFEIAVDGMYVYFTDFDNGQVQRMRRDGSGKTELLAANQPRAKGISIDYGYVYWANNMSNEIRRMPKAGGNVQILQSEQTAASSVYAGDDYVYWTVDDEIRRVSVCACKL